MSEAAADTRDESPRTTARWGAPGADLGLRQDRGSRLRPGLAGLGVEILSTGGTAAALREAGPRG